MKKILLLSLSLITSLAAFAQDPLLPLRLELENSFAPQDSTVYLKIAIHSGNDRNILWSNSVITPDYEPLYGVACQMNGHTAYLLLGDTSLSNMEALPRDLFSDSILLKIRVWISTSPAGAFRQLTPDLDLVASPYSLYSKESKDVDPAVIAEHTSALTTLNNSLRTANAKIAGLQSVSSGLTNGTIALPSVNPLLGRVVTGSSGELVIKADSPVAEPLTPPTLPVHFDISYATYFASPIILKRSAYPKSVTLYFKNKNEIAPPQAVCIFESKPLISVLATAVSISTAAFPRCVYTFSSSISQYPPGEYLVGLKTTANYPVIHPYICQGYRHKAMRYYYEEPSMEPSLSAVVPPSQNIYWKFNDVKELWLEFSAREDNDIAVTSSGLSLKGDILLNSQPVLTEDQLPGIVSSLLGESVFIEEEDLSQELRRKIITSAGGAVTGSLFISQLQLPVNGNWYIGSVSNRCDLVLMNSNAYIRSHSGDLNLSAAGDIKPLSIIDFSPSQCGRADIPRNEREVVIFPSGLTEDAVVIVTPAQKTDAAYWVEIDPLGQAKIRLDAALDQTVSFYYALIRK